MWGRCSESEDSDARRRRRRRRKEEKQRSKDKALKLKKSGSKDKKRAKDKKHKDRERRSSKDKGPVQLSKVHPQQFGQFVIFLSLLCILYPVLPPLVAEDLQRMLCSYVTTSASDVLCCIAVSCFLPTSLAAATRVTSQFLLLGLNILMT